MCTECQSIPAILSKKIIISDHKYNLLSIRSIDKKLFFTQEHFTIIQPGDRYWVTPGIHVCDLCRIRNINNNMIAWGDYDYHMCPVNLDGNLVNIGNQILNQILKLKVFI